MTRRLPLFDDKARTDPEPAYARESTYAFLDRVNDPVFAAVRAVLNAWVDRFASLHDDTDISDLVGRLRSKEDIAFYAAFWELYLHELFVRLGFSIEVHPESGKDTRPDFRLTRDGREIYLEAVMPNPPGQPLQGVEGIQDGNRVHRRRLRPGFLIESSIRRGQRKRAVQEGGCACGRGLAC